MGCRSRQNDGLAPSLRLVHRTGYAKPGKAHRQRINVVAHSQRNDGHMRLYFRQNQLSSILTVGKEGVLSLTHACRYSPDRDALVGLQGGYVISSKTVELKIEREFTEPVHLASDALNDIFVAQQEKLGEDFWVPVACANDAPSDELSVSESTASTKSDASYVLFPKTAKKWAHTDINNFVVLPPALAAALLRHSGTLKPEEAIALLSARFKALAAEQELPDARIKKWSDYFNWLVVWLGAAEEVQYFHPVEWQRSSDVVHQDHIGAVAPPNIVSFQAV